MKVINESFKVDNKDLLPEILMRIFSVCKADPSFPLREKFEGLEEEANDLYKRIEKQDKILKEFIELRDNSSNKLQTIRQENFELKSRLLEELGSDI